MAAAPPLAEVRVVTWTRSLGGRFAGFLLTSLGADVVAVEDPAVARATPGDHVLARDVRSVGVARATAGDGALWRRLAAGADAVVVDEAAPAVADDGERVVCRVAAWGREAPHVDLPGDEALIAAATGVHALQWSWAKRPVWLVTPVVGYMTGLLAAFGTTAALLARRRGAPGQAVDVSGVGAAFALNSGTYVTALGGGFEGSLTRHGDPRGVYPTYCLYQTADGWLFVGALTQTFWVKLMVALGRHDLLAEPRLQANPLAFGVPEIRDFVRGELDPVFRARPTAAWIETLRAADVPCGPVQTRAAYLADPEAEALGLVAHVDDPILGPTRQPPAVAAFSDTPARRPGAAPRPDADGAALAEEPRRRRAAPAAGGGGAAGCLAGIRVLDLTSYIAGPVCPMLLADLGADVVKVESAEGDPFRTAAFGFLGWNRGKRSLVLDLKRAEGRDVLLDLARAADVVVDNFRAGVMERLGLGWDALHEANPRLVHTSITGFGPESTLPGFDPIFQARSGLMAAQGGADAPVFHLIAYNDYCAGALAALATVAALVARERTGRGQQVDVSLFRTAFVVQAAEMIAYPGCPPAATGGRDHLGPGAARRLYACADGWVCVAAGDAAAASALGAFAGARIGADDPPDGRAAAAVERRLAALPRAEALAALAAAGVPATACASLEDLFADPALRASGAFVEQDHPSLGRVLLPGPFVRFGATPAPPPRPAPRLGADGAAVLGEIGYSAERIAALVAAGVVGASAG